MDKLKYCKLTNNISLIQLNNISKKNALSFELLKEMKSIVNKIDRETKVVILESLCENVFSSGHDLSELFHSTPNELHSIMNICSDLMLIINKSEKLFIAEIDGLATAAGLQLASSCDFIIASSRSKFSIPGANIGLYAATPAIKLINFLPSKVAFEMLR
jgi:enoyl-CoA hydratase/carnithine racemase